MKNYIRLNLGPRLICWRYSAWPICIPWANLGIEMYPPENAKYLRYYLKISLLYYIVSIFTMYVSTSRILRWFTNFKLTRWVRISKTCQRVEMNIYFCWVVALSTKEWFGSSDKWQHLTLWGQTASRESKIPVIFSC